MAVQPTLYATADGNRRPWYIVAIKSGASTRDFRIVHSEEEQSAAVAEFREKYGLSNCQVYVAEGYWNIQG